MVCVRFVPGLWRGVWRIPRLGLCRGVRPGLRVVCVPGLWRGVRLICARMKHRVKHSRVAGIPSLVLAVHR